MTIGSQMPELDQATFIDFNFLALHLLAGRYFNCYSQATFWLYIYIYIYIYIYRKAHLGFENLFAIYPSV